MSATSWEAQAGVCIGGRWDYTNIRSNTMFGCYRWTETISQLHSCDSWLRRMAQLHIILSIFSALSWATEVVTTPPPVDIYWNRTNHMWVLMILSLTTNKFKKVWLERFGYRFLRAFCYQVRFKELKWHDNSIKKRKNGMLLHHSSARICRADHNLCLRKAHLIIFTCSFFDHDRKRAFVAIL